MKRAGRKFTSSHTTIIDAASLIADFADTHQGIEKISLGLIKSMKSSGGIKRLKITEEDACLLVTVRGNTAFQELRLYTKDKKSLAHDIRRFAKSSGFIL